MLVVISDIHFSDGTVDVFNVPAYAFRVMVDRLRAIIARPETRIDHVEVLLLGDIFDVLRSDQWRAGPMPWDGPTPALGARVARILDGILTANAEAIGVLRRLADELGLAVAHRYLPGNHDRMLNWFPSTRRRLVEALGLAHPPDRPFATSHLWPDYRVLAEHGDRHDPFNREVAPRGSCVGDAIVVKLMNGFFLHLRDWLADHELPQDYRWVALRAQEADHVRPKWATPIWLQSLLGRVDDPRVREALGRAWDKAVGEFLGVDLSRFGVEADRSVLRLLPRSAWQPAASLLDHPLVKTLLAQRDQGFVRAVAHESRLRQREADYIVYGHVHRPCHVPLDADGDRQRVYFNTGTWRHTINLVETPARPRCLLVPWEEMTFLVFYKPGENAAHGRQYHFEMWQGMRA